MLLPTYNSATILKNTIGSILQQTLKEFEFLILDDGSNDNTELIISKLRDTRIRYYQLPHKGLSETLNSGLVLASYDIIARMDAGDMSAPDRFEKQYSLLSSSTENTIVASHYAVFYKNCIQYVVRSNADHHSIKRRLALHPDFPHSGVMYRKSFILENGGYRDVPLEDYDLWLRIKNKALFRLVEENLHFVEYTANRLSTNNVPQKMLNHYKLQESYYKKLDNEFGINIPKEQQEILGWREYFYGNPFLARKLWMGTPTILLGSYKTMIAFIISMLPEKLFVWIKESRLRFRINYIYRYYSRENRIVRKQFSLLITAR
ncbi:MAG: glycosyltransferase [Bacteroidota bacterium]